MTWDVPNEVGEYRIVRPLGAGTMGAVFLAHDTRLDRPVVIKFLRALEMTAGQRERFFTEVRAVAQLLHRSIVAVYRVGKIGQFAYLVMEYVQGTSLAAIAKPMAWERALHIGIDLARGLGAAHRRHVLHRDIKPANILLGERDQPKLLDFGLANIVEGTALAPELWRGARASRASDVYALGVVLYELFAGQVPHAGLTTLELATRVPAEDAAPIRSRAAQIPVRLAAVIDSCLSREPARRPGSGDELGELLEEAVPRWASRPGRGGAA